MQLSGGEFMATIKNDGYRHGAIRDRSQYHDVKTDTYRERDTNTGEFTRGKQGAPYKNVRKEN
jgi:hypothetical protein